MRPRPPAISLLSFMILLAGQAAGFAGEGDRDAHGKFTGEMKPVIYVADVRKSAPFYRDALGFRLDGFAGKETDPYYAEMLAAGVKFGLHEPTSDDQKEKVGSQRLYFRVEDLEAHRKRVLAWGAEAGPIKKTAWMDMFIAKDPDGNEIVFAMTDPDRHSIDPWKGAGAGDRREEPSH